MTVAASKSGQTGEAATGPSSHFELFDIAVAFAIDEAKLHRNWLLRQQEYHPDRYMNLPLRQRTRAIKAATAATANINSAYRTLADPLTRAIYLLGLRSYVIDSQESSTDEAFLGQMMQLRMDLESRAEAGEEAPLRDLLADIEARCRDYERELASLFDGPDGEQGGKKRLLATKKAVIEYRFVTRLLTQGRQALRQRQE